MYGKATYIKVNQLRYDSLHRNIKVHQVMYSLSLVASYSPCIVLVFLLLAEYHLKRMFKDPTIKHLYQFPNVSSHECRSWKVDDGL